MANLTLRSVKGAPLTHEELDGNFEYFTGSINVINAATGSFLTSAATASMNISNALYTVNTALSASTTSSATTSVCSYGVNVFEYITPTNFATKLPQPVTGKSVKIINNGINILRVYPSNVGGQINNLPINTPAYLPPDGNLYEFICIENPLPGDWTFSAPAIGQIELPEISVSHTNLTNTYSYGVGLDQLTATTNQFGETVTASESNGIITLLPGNSYWRTESFKATLFRIKCYSNYVDTDGINEPIISRYVAYMPAINGLNVYTASGISLVTHDTVGNGIINTPEKIGDTGTFYKLQDAFPVQIPPVDTDELGTGVFSNHYYIFGIKINATSITKVYKFKIILEYI